MTLFAFPEAARVGRRIPRDTLFRAGGGGKAVRALYELEVDRIDWAFKLFERSVNLPPSGGLTEIQVFHIALRGDTLDDRVLQHLDRAMPRATWFELTRMTPDGAQIQVAAGYKRPSDVDRTQVVTLAHWRGPWLPADAPRDKMPSAITLEGLYAGLLRSLWPHPARRDESLREQAERLSAAAAQAKTVARLATQVRREKDFSRQVERNHELRSAQAALNELVDAR